MQEYTETFNINEVENWRLDKRPEIEGLVGDEELRRSSTIDDFRCPDGLKPYEKDHDENRTRVLEAMTVLADRLEGLEFYEDKATQRRRAHVDSLMRKVEELDAKNNELIGEADALRVKAAEADRLETRVKELEDQISNMNTSTSDEGELASFKRKFDVHFGSLKLVVEYPTEYDAFEEVTRFIKKLSPPEAMDVGD